MATLAPVAPAGPAPAAAPSRAILAVLAVIALLALAIPLALVLTTPRMPAASAVAAAALAPKRVVPQTELPPVEPVALADVAADDARAINAAIPFSTAPNPAARPFRLAGGALDQARAVDCLAAAVYYEAGDDAVGERAVAQVVLNRVRHPAFPNSVCGVVFQGAERSTGCQFTFTCDGSLARRLPGAAAWSRARAIAQAALGGAVYAPVGHATHYHTDWVVPYWSSSLEKITEVHTHLFFRWAGWWGTPPAFANRYSGAEPNIGKLSALSAAHSAAPAAGENPLIPNVTDVIAPESIADSSVPKPIAGSGDAFLVTLERGMAPDAFAALAIKTCGERSYCKFMAWSEARQTPDRLPLNPTQVATMAFSYLRDENQGFAKALWNCAQYKRPSPVQCMRAQPLAASAQPAPATAAPAPVPAAAASDREPPQLTGIRRKRDTGGNPAVKFTIPAPKPTPAPGE